MKIISLVPSITETLFDFGLTRHEVIGRTKFCIHPASSVQDTAIIGGTKNLNIEKIAALKPDLIIANKEENEKSQIQELQKSWRVWVTDIATMKDNNNFLWEMGMLLKKEALAKHFTKEIDKIFSAYKSNSLDKKKVAYLIWKNPLMTAGNDTFISNVLSEIGFNNIFSDQKRYPMIESEDLREADFIFLSSEPYPFQQKHLKEFESNAPKSKVILVDGEAFSWFGTHLLQCGDYFKKLRSLQDLS